MELFKNWNNIKNLVRDDEGSDYDAHRFQMNGLIVIYRYAKITPTKLGQFVTLWKREKPGQPIAPYDVSDDFDLVLIAVRRGEQRGYFLFSKDELLKHRIISRNHRGGKRALRLYAPWDMLESKQAKMTQCWQSKYFYSDDEKLYKRIFLCPI